MKKIIAALCIALLGLSGWAQEKDVRHWSVGADFGMTAEDGSDYEKYWQIDAKTSYRMPIYGIFIFQPEAGLNFKKRDYGGRYVVISNDLGYGLADKRKTSPYAHTVGLNLNALVGLSVSANTLLVKRLDVLTGPTLDWDFAKSVVGLNGGEKASNFRSTFMYWRFGLGFGLSKSFSLNGSYNLKLINKNYCFNYWTVGLSYHFRP